MVRTPSNKWASSIKAYHGHNNFYVSTHVFEFPINTIIAWIINDYHEQGNMIITKLLLPLGHISNSLPLALESIILSVLEHFTPMAYRCNTCFIFGIDFIIGSNVSGPFVSCISSRFHAIIKFTNFINLALYMFWIIW